MRRRAVILTAASAVAWSLFAHSAAAAGAKKIGAILAGTAETDAAAPAFLAGMRELGYAEGGDFIFEPRYFGSETARLDGIAEALVRSGVDLIVTSGLPPARAAMRASAHLPIVLAGVADPVSEGFAQSLARPGGRITGLTIMSPEVTIKRIELAKELMPSARRIAFLARVGNAAHSEPTRIQAYAAVSQALALDTRVFALNEPGELSSLFDAMASWEADAIVPFDSGVFNRALSGEIAASAARIGRPLVCGSSLTASSCLASYYVGGASSWRRVARHVDRILKGTDPGDVPFEQPTTFELVVNLKIARTLGISVPESILLRADAVIE